MVDTNKPKSKQQKITQRENLNIGCLREKKLAVASSCDLQYFVEYLNKNNYFKEISYNFKLGTSDDASIEILRDNNVFYGADIAVASVAETSKKLFHPLAKHWERNYDTVFENLSVSVKKVLDYLNNNFEHSFIFNYPFNPLLLDLNDRPWVYNSCSFWLNKTKALYFDLLSQYDNKIDFLDLEEAFLPIGFSDKVFRQELWGGHPEKQGAAYLANLFLERLISRIDLSHKIKAIALDLDNTLWEGVFLESDTPPQFYKNRVATLVNHAKNGIPVCIVSKNNAEDTQKILTYIQESFPELAKNIVKCYISWDRKSQSIAKMANDLGIGTEAIAFFDDSEFERGEVKATIPSVKIYKETEIINSPRYAEFSFYKLSKDARRRVQTYKENINRSDYEETTLLGLEDYLLSLNFCISFDRATIGSLDRVEELVQRTNQQNLLLNRTKREVIKNYILDNRCIVISLNDKFGAYGTIGTILYDIKDDRVELTELAISCRALGKGVEECIIAFLNKFYGEIKHELSFNVITNYKNKNFYEKMIGCGFVHDKENNRMSLILNKNIEYPKWFSVKTNL